MSIPRYSRWTVFYDRGTGVDRVEFRAPDGDIETRPTFTHQPARLVYDDRGYEHVETEGEPVLAVRFTPTIVGDYRYRAMTGETCVEEGQFSCAPSDHPGYVQVSPHDGRYFCHSDGTPFCPIGLCLVGPPRYPLSRGSEHFQTGDDFGTLGCFDYRRWFRLLSHNGGNFTRIWLSNPYFNVEPEVAGELDRSASDEASARSRRSLAAFARLDRLVELARQYGIRLKLCFDHFRTFEPGTFFYKDLRHPEDGRRPADIDEWLREPTWRELWLKKARAYIARYGGDPTVMAWELWNEMDCVRGRWELVRDWTRDMLRELKRLAPRQLVVNSLGSFDHPRKVQVQDDFLMDEMDFQQVHRYLDQGAPWDICTIDPVAFSVQAIQATRRPDRPILLAETGAVNDRHTGPFRFYRLDNRGIIFHDTTYPAFFAGAAGTGQIWHWDQYVDQKNLWRFFRPFADLVRGIELDAEGFTPIDLSTDRVWFLGLLGKRHLLAWLRDKADSWHAVLRDEIEPDEIEPSAFDLGALGLQTGKVTLVSPWEEGIGEATLADGRLSLPSFRYGLMVRAERA
jgi:hypothetical protein